MSDRDLSGADIRDERLGEVDVTLHWAYLVGVVAGGALLMLVLIVLLDAAS